MLSSKNGQIVSKLPLLDLVTTLRAKWTSDIFCSEQWFTYANLWIEEMQVISDLYNFICINHLIASSRNLNKTSKKMSKFTHAFMEAFMAMKFKVKNPLSWEFIMDQPIFYNKCITNPNTNQPYDRHQPPFKDMKGINTSTCSMYSIYSLTNFKFEEYRKDPEITNNSIYFLNPRQLKQT